MRQQPKAGRHEKHFNRCFAHLLSSNESQQEIFYFQKNISENACEVAAALQEAEDLVTRLEQALSSPTCSSVGQNIEGATKNCGVIETHVNTQETALESYVFDLRSLHPMDIISIGRGIKADVRTLCNDGHVSREHAFCALGKDGIFRIGRSEDNIIVPVYGSIIGGASDATNIFSENGFRVSEDFDKVTLTRNNTNSEYESTMKLDMPRQFANSISEFPVLLIMEFLFDDTDDGSRAFAFTNTHYAKGASILLRNPSDWFDASPGRKDFFWCAAKRKLTTWGRYEMFSDTDEFETEGDDSKSGSI